MIWESEYWRKPLLKMADRLRKFKSAAGLTENQFVQIEKDVFIGFYSIRKLFETVTKVTDATKEKKIQIIWYPNKKPVNLRNNQRIEELYDLEAEHKETRDLQFICGRIIHSFVFVIVIDDNGGLAEIMFTSDTDKNKRIYSLDIESVIETFELVGKDNPTSVEWSIDPVSGKETTKVR